ncbi:MAG: hypothetical protein E6R07_09510 [Nevskiaceae bacterium]|nr:MAG: hypothetical protein E6R07_09510 [Nevskiaceae bacterium]
MSIPQTIRVSSAVNREAHYVGELPVKALPRLREALAGDGGSVQADLLAWKSSGYPALSGTLRATLDLECRRCGAVFAYALAHKLDLRLVSSEEEEARLIRDCEPYQVQDDELALHELIEDETLLALPMLPRCESCENVRKEASATTPETEMPRRENPFAALKKLKL